MKVRLLTDRADMRGYQQAGSVIDIDRREARSLIAAGQAEPAGEAATDADELSNNSTNKRRI